MSFGRLQFPTQRAVVQCQRHFRQGCTAMPAIVGVVHCHCCQRTADELSTTLADLAPPVSYLPEPRTWNYHPV